MLVDEMTSGGSTMGPGPGTPGGPPADVAPAVEPARTPDEAPASVPVAPVVVHRRRQPHVRLWVALLATIAVLAGALGFAVFAAARQPVSPTLAYVPANALAYAEGRLDFPGDQRDQAGRFLAHFPGFLDPGSLDTKLNNAFDQLVQKAFGQQYSYTGDYKPWASGPIAVLALPQSADAFTLPRPSASPGAGVLAASFPPLDWAYLVAVSDQAKAQAELDKIRTSLTASGTSATSQELAGTTVWTVEVMPAPDATGGALDLEPSVSYGLLPGMLVVANRADVVARIADVKAGHVAALDSTDRYKGVSGWATGDHVGSVYLDVVDLQKLMVAYLEQVQATVPSAGMPPLASLLPSDALARIPDAAYGTLRFDDDRLVLDGRTSPVPGSPAPAVRQTDLAAHVPGDTLVYMETRDLGKALGTLLGQVASMPGVADQVGGQLSQLEKLLGGDLGSLVSWVGDAAVAIEANPGATPSGGIVANVTDADQAATRVNQIKTLLGLGGASQGLTLTDSQHAGTTVTTITMSSNPGLRVSFALANGRFILGVGEGFVERVLDVTPATSLGGTTRFSDALGAAGGPATAGVLYVDIKGVREAVEATLPSSQRTTYDTDTRPYIAPFDRLLVASGESDGARTGRAVLYVATQPR